MKKIWFVLVLVILSACAPRKTENNIVAKLDCAETECTVSIENKNTDIAVKYAFSVGIEETGMPIGERKLYANTPSERHEWWEYQFRPIFNHNDDVLAPGETESYKIQIHGAGMTLVQLLVWIGNDEQMLEEYQLIKFPLNTNGDLPIQNELTCDRNRITARTKLTQGVLDQDMAIYVINNLDVPYVTFKVQDGQEVTVDVPLPVSARLVELDVVGHKILYTNLEEVKEAHRFRVYCIPSE